MNKNFALIQEVKNHDTHSLDCCGLGSHKGFFTTYKKGTWDKGGVGKAIFAYSMIVYIAAFVIGMYAINKKILEFGFALPEFFDKTKRTIKLFFRKLFGKTYASEEISEEQV